MKPYGLFSLSVPVSKASTLPRGGFLINRIANFDPNSFNYRKIHMS